MSLSNGSYTGFQFLKISQKIAFYLLEVSLHQRPTMQILCLLDNSKHTVTISCSQYSMMNHQIGTDRHVYFLDQGYVKFLILWMVLFFLLQRSLCYRLCCMLHTKRWSGKLDKIYKVYQNIRARRGRVRHHSNLACILHYLGYLRRSILDFIFPLKAQGGFTWQVIMFSSLDQNLESNTLSKNLCTFKKSMRKFMSRGIEKVKNCVLVY